jgi:hypothetical protein
MDKDQIFFAVLQISSGKFVSAVTVKSGRVYLVKKPWASNYFVSTQYAETWMRECKLPDNEYEVKAFADPKAAVFLN